MAGNRLWPGALLRGREWVCLHMSLVIDNFEGLTVRESSQGEILLDLISDDNFKFFFSRRCSCSFVSISLAVGNVDVKGASMPIRSAAVGNETPPQVVDITPRRLLAYAAGLGESHPRYLDDVATTGLVGHPAFCVVLEWPVTLMLREAESLGMSWEEKIRGVHAAQDSIFHRPIHPGDRLRTVASLVQIRRIRPGAFVLTKFETMDDRTDAPVVTSYASSIYRDVEGEGEDVSIEEAPSLPTACQSTASLTQIPIPIAREAPHVYTECAQIWNPIHTERQVALQAGLPDIILHGTATWALAAGHLIQHCAQAEPTRLRRFIGRFTAMVIPGSTITLEYREPEGEAVSYSVCNAEGELAISQGMAVLGEPEG